MSADELPEEMLRRVTEATGLVRGSSQVRVISHYDADGISSAGIASAALIRAGKGIQVSMVKSLDSDLVRRLRELDHECILFLDMGSGLLTELESLDSKVIILDHHAPTGDSDAVIHVNAHSLGIDGMSGASASAITMLFAITLDERNWSLLPMAFAGIAGDRQDVRGLSGLNAWLLEGGVSRGLVQVRRRSLIPDDELASLGQRYEPFISGVSGDAQGTRTFLESAGLTVDERGSSMDEGKRRKLASLMVLSLLEQGTETQTLEELTGEAYYFPSMGMDAGEMASLLNGCGRMGKEGLGLALLMGDQQALEEARILKDEYGSEVLSALKAAVDEIIPMNSIQFFHNRNPSLSGVACGIVMQYIADKKKPTLALAVSGNTIRVSSRATFSLLKEGVDLSEALRKAAERAGGVGGGHAIASGATVPLGKEEEFLGAVDDIVAEQKGLKA